MIKILGLTSIVLSSLILSGCGGEDKKNPLNDKNYIIILEAVPAGLCESDEFRADISDLGLGDVITEETNDNTSCKTYGKTNDDIECATSYVSQGPKNCVIGFDNIPSGYSGLAKQTTELKLFDTVEMISSIF